MRQELSGPSPGVRLRAALRRPEACNDSEEAKKIGADYIVVGRPITLADDQVEAYEDVSEKFLD